MTKTHRVRGRQALWALLLLAGASGAVLAAEGPRAVVDETIVDVGNVPKGKPIRRDFTIRNTGDAELSITQVKPACGCTVADYARRIPAGGAGKVTVVVKTTDFVGPIAKSVAVFTDDPATPKIQLVIKANIRTEVEVSPSYARFIVVQDEGYEPVEHRLSSTSDRAFEVLGVTSPLPFLDAQVSGGGTDWTVRLELDEEAPVGPIADFVVIRTDIPEQPEVKLPVSGFVRPPLVVIPQIFDFGRRKLEEPYPGKVQVQVVGSRAVQLGEITIDLPGVEAEIEEVEAGKLYNLVIRLQPELAAGPAQGVVTIATDNERYPVLEIPIRGTVL